MTLPQEIYYDHGGFSSESNNINHPLEFKDPTLGQASTAILGLTKIQIDGRIIENQPMLSQEIVASP